MYCKNTKCTHLLIEQKGTHCKVCKSELEEDITLNSLSMSGLNLPENGLVLKLINSLSGIYKDNLDIYNIRYLLDTLELALKLNYFSGSKIEKRHIIIAVMFHKLFHGIERENYAKLAEMLFKIKSQRLALELTTDESAMISAAILNQNADRKQTDSNILTDILSASKIGEPNLKTIVNKLYGLYNGNVKRKDDKDIYQSIITHVNLKYTRDGYLRYPQIYKDYFGDTFKEFLDDCEVINEDKVKLYLTRDMPLFIVLEGIDGAGKSTVSRILKEYLSKTLNSGNVYLDTEPTKGKVGKLIREYLSEDSPDEDVIKYLYLADRSEHVENIKVRLSDNKSIVISDRYFYSSLAYNSRNLGIKDGIDLNSHFPKPDLVFYLDIDVDTSLKRLNNTSNALEVFETRDRLEEIKENYELICDTFNFIEIDGDRDPEDIVKEIYKEIINFKGKDNAV